MDGLKLIFHMDLHLMMLKVNCYIYFIFQQSILLDCRYSMTIKLVINAKEDKSF